MASKRKKVMMVSEGKLPNGKPTKSVYYTTKGAQHAEKLKLNKFDVRTGKYEVFNEKKVPK